MYNSFGSNDLRPEDDEEDFSYDEPEKSACSARAMLCSVSVTVMLLGGTYCLFATYNGFRTENYETVLLWGCFLGILGHFAAAMATMVIYWQYDRGQILEDEVSRLLFELENRGGLGAKDLKGRISRVKNLEGDGSLQRFAHSTGEILTILDGVEEEVLTHDVYNELQASIMEMKKAAYTQEASMLHCLGSEMKKIGKKDVQLVNEDEWSSVVNRIPNASQYQELEFRVASRGRNLASWERASHLINAFIRARLQAIGRILHELDEQTGVQDRNKKEKPVRENAKKFQMEYALKKHKSALKELKNRYEDKLGRLEIENQTDHEQIRDLSVQLRTIRNEVNNKS
mmetsp:Transcript_25489/g.61393  ORF Transcript_25489/g.61393 Transcript_25489/m.61393 type:complete len:343 (-) Transcript_25489:543-1571(-)